MLSPPFSFGAGHYALRFKLVHRNPFPTIHMHSSCRGHVLVVWPSYHCYRVTSCTLCLYNFSPAVWLFPSTQCEWLHHQSKCGQSPTMRAMLGHIVYTQQLGVVICSQSMIWHNPFRLAWVRPRMLMGFNYFIVNRGQPMPRGTLMILVTNFLFLNYSLFPHPDPNSHWYVYYYYQFIVDTRKKSRDTKHGGCDINHIIQMVPIGF